jgi:alpha-beta hydrolase superfamily lysophospholipase
MRWFPILPCLATLLACSHTPTPYDTMDIRPPMLATDHVLADDGHRLPLFQHEAEGTPRAVVLALHGFGDYSAAFQTLAGHFAAAGITLYAYDQRGFGATERPGVWAGAARMTADVGNVAQLLRQRHPDLPFYLMGKSMGGAVALLARTEQAGLPVDGVALIAPAVWGWDSMPWYQRLGLRVLGRVAPGLELSGDMARRLGIRPSDDPAVLRALSLDPLVQKRARVDTLMGLTGLMDAALEASARLPGPALLLYGGQDQVIPPRPVCRLLERLPEPRDGDWRMAFYPQGYHMLTRYTGAALTHQDLIAWFLDPRAALPSGAELDRAQARQRLCGIVGAGS